MSEGYVLAAGDWQALWLTARLALTVTVLLLLLGTPLAWFLARSNSWWKSLVSAVVAMPLVLPPTVLGFYFLIFSGPNSFLGRWMAEIGLPTLPFTFAGLVVASMIYSLPFMVQPLQTAFERLGNTPLEIAATLRASPLDAFFTVIVPLSRGSFASAILLTFAHTVGEFGVIMMIGGNLPGITRVASVQIFNHVESLAYDDAHRLAVVLMIFSFALLLALHSLRKSKSYFG